jgi:hypothetical protein
MASGKMIRSRRNLLVAATLCAVTLTGCGQLTGGTPAPVANPQYTALRDSLVCVVDRTAPSGLVRIPAKVDGSRVVLLVDNAIVPLETEQPISVIAGYAGSEAWLVRGDPLSLGGNQYKRSQPATPGGSSERRVEPDLLRRAGEYMGILLFAGATDDPPPDALYVPTAPGCIFQPYVRSDLIRR